MNNFIKELAMKRALASEEDKKNLEGLQEVQKLLDGNKDYDIIFKMQDKEIPAHKNILSLRSSYFSNMFMSKIFEGFFC